MTKKDEDFMGRHVVEPQHPLKMADIRLEKDKKHHEIHNHKHHIYGNRDSIFCDSDRKCAD